MCMLLTFCLCVRIPYYYHHYYYLFFVSVCLLYDSSTLTYPSTRTKNSSDAHFGNVQSSVKPNICMRPNANNDNNCEYDDNDDVDHDNMEEAKERVKVCARASGIG